LWYGRSSRSAATRCEPIACTPARLRRPSLRMGAGTKAAGCYGETTHSLSLQHCKRASVSPCGEDGLEDGERAPRGDRRRPYLCQFDTFSCHSYHHSLYVYIDLSESVLLGPSGLGSQACDVEVRGCCISAQRMPQSKVPSAVIPTRVGASGTDRWVLHTKGPSTAAPRPPLFGVAPRDVAHGDPLSRFQASSGPIRALRRDVQKHADNRQVRAVRTPLTDHQCPYEAVAQRTMRHDHAILLS
jgi:hypothetical protein